MRITQKAVRIFAASAAIVIDLGLLIFEPSNITIYKWALYFMVAFTAVTASALALDEGAKKDLYSPLSFITIGLTLGTVLQKPDFTWLAILLVPIGAELVLDLGGWTNKPKEK